LGNNPLEIALSPLTKPLVVWRLLVRPASLSALKMVTLPFAFLNVLGLPVFALAAPALAITLLSNNPLQQQLETWHYAAPMLPFVSLAVADGLRRIQNSKFKMQYGRLSFYTLHFAFFIVAILGYHYLRGYSPLSKPFHNPQLTVHHRLGDEIAASIPPSASVVAQAELEPHLSQRRQVSIWQGDFPATADYIFVDVSHPKFVNRNNAQANFLSSMIYNHNFGIVTDEDGYLLLQRGAVRRPTQEGFQKFLFATENWFDAPAIARFGDFVSLVGMETHLNRAAEPQMTLYFRVLKQPAEDYFLRLYLLNENNEPEGATIFQQPVLVWWPTHLWQAGKIIKVRFNTLPWWTDDGKHRRFGYAVGISRSGDNPQADPWDESLRLPVTGNDVLPGNLVPVGKFYRLAGMVYVVREK